MMTINTAVKRSLSVARAGGVCAVLFTSGAAIAQAADPSVPAIKQASGTTTVAVAQPKNKSASEQGGMDAALSVAVEAKDSEAGRDVAAKPEQVSGPVLAREVVDIRAPARNAYVPRMRWQHMEGHTVWTRAALSALKDHGRPLVNMVPRDIANWCPAYPSNTDAQRRAFWVGYMSALAKHESTYKPWAVGGGGRWYGLLQILPATARGYKCNVGTGEALKNGAANLSCGVRSMAHPVQRDGVIHGRDKKWRGVSAEWGPMRSESKRRDMAAWLKRQNYCVATSSTRPRARP